LRTVAHLLEYREHRPWETQQFGHNLSDQYPLL
jgi:hypothetical protein